MAYSTNERKRILAFYNRRIAKYEMSSPRAVGWNSDETQMVRFKALLDVGDLSNASLLDIGCGTGDLIPFLEDRYNDFKYRGIDINPKFIATAKEWYPNHDFSVEEFSQATDKTADYIFVSGVLNNKIDNYRERNFALLKKMFDSANLGIAFNLLDERNHTSTGPYATYKVSEVEKFCRELTNKITVRQDYLPHDFTVYLYH